MIVKRVKIALLLPLDQLIYMKNIRFPSFTTHKVDRSSYRLTYKLRRHFVNQRQLTSLSYFRLNRVWESQMCPCQRFTIGKNEKVPLSNKNIWYIVHKTIVITYQYTSPKLDAMPAIDPSLLSSISQFFVFETYRTQHFSVSSKGIVASHIEMPVYAYVINTSVLHLQK